VVGSKGIGAQALEDEGLQIRALGGAPLGHSTLWVKSTLRYQLFLPFPSVQWGP